MKRISITTRDFERLVNNKTVKKDGVEFGLQDIGFVTMMNLVRDAFDSADDGQRDISEYLDGKAEYMKKNS